MTKFTKGEKRDEFRSSTEQPPASLPPPTAKQEQQQTGQQVSEFYATLVNTSRKPWASVNNEEKEHPESTHATLGLGFPPQNQPPPTTAPVPKFEENEITILHPAAQNEDAKNPTTDTSRHDKMSTDLIALPKSNIGYKLLEKAGWKGHGGIGAREQGRIEPIQADKRQGNVGLGFETKKTRRNSRTKGTGESNSTVKERTDDGGGRGGDLKISKNKKKVLSLAPDELANEDIEKKVKRVKQVMQTEADEEAGKELARLVYSAFRDGGGGGGSTTTDVNPLLRKNRKLSSRNPLL